MKRWKTLTLGKITLSLRQVLTSNLMAKAATETYPFTKYKRLDILILFVYGEDYTERYTAWAEHVIRHSVAMATNHSKKTF